MYLSQRASSFMVATLMGISVNAFAADPPSAQKPAASESEPAPAGAPDKEKAPLATASAGPVATPTATPPAPAPPAPPLNVKPPRLLVRNKFVPLLAAIDGSPLIFASYTLLPGLLVGAGAGLTYNPNGLVGSTGPDPPTTSGLIALFVFYGIKDKFPVSIGPEFLYVAQVAPGDPVHILNFGPGMYYAPFSAPVIIGVGWNLRLTLINGQLVSFDWLTSSLRLGFVWN